MHLPDLRRGALWRGLGPRRDAVRRRRGGLCNGEGACVPCLVDGDCGDATLVCADQRCVPGSCDDGEKNGDEVEVDCGGSCGRCADGSDCGTAEDCLSGVCDAGTCAPCGSTSDCEALPDHYCAAGTCTPRVALGELCGGDEECSSGHCVDGVCCDGACDGTCESCSAVKTGGDYGVCTPVPDGTDPDDDCPALWACNGAGQCRLL